MQTHPVNVKCDESNKRPSQVGSRRLEWVIGQVGMDSKRIKGARNLTGYVGLNTQCHGGSYQSAIQSKMYPVQSGWAMTLVGRLEIEMIRQCKAH